MANSGDVLRNFYQAIVARDFAAASKYQHDDMVFDGLFESYPNADAYMATFQGLLSITKRLDVLAVIAEGNEVAVFFELETGAPALATTLVAEWHRVRDGKIYHARSAFDGRPFAAMFSGAKKG
jgi:predicted SnoaL-like aldol condensation-catalyzing enzyme